MPEILIQSKITVPRLSDKIVHREVLNKLLSGNIDKSLIIVYAPAGFGKTTLALDYLTRQTKPFIWFGVPSGGINDVTTFFEYLVYGLKNLNKKFGYNTLEIMKSAGQDRNLAKEIAQVLARSFVNEFCKHFTEEVIIVIDDLHYIDTEESLKWLNEVFAELLDNVPPNMHLLLISRRMPEFNLTHLKSKRNLFVVAEKELGFNQNETGELLGNVYGYKHNSEDVKLIDDRLKGWVTGIHLLLQAYGEDFNKIKFTEQVAPEIIFDFFAHEIFENLTAEIQEFLMVTSVVENFTEDLSNILLEKENSGEILRELTRRNLFITSKKSYEFDKSDKSDKSYYKYHDLFRDFLSSKLNESKTAQEIKCLKTKTGDYYERTGDTIQAINYFIEAEEFEKAVPLIIRDYKVLNEKLSTSKWLLSIPENMIKLNPHLLYYLGNMHIANGNYEKSISCFDEALKLIDIAENEDLVVQCYSGEALALLLQGKSERAINQINKILNANLKPVNKAEILYCLGANGYHDQPKKAIEIFNEALSICNEHGIKETSRIYNELGNANIDIGNLGKAVLCYQFALNNSSHIVVKLMATLNLSRICLYLGQINKSKDYLDEANELIKIYPSYKDVTYCTRAHARLLFCSGDFEESTKYYANAYDMAIKSNNIPLATDVNQQIASCFFYMSDKNTALEYLNRDREHLAALLAAYEAERLIDEEVGAYIITENKLNPSVEENLLKAFSYFESINLKEDINFAAFGLTRYYLKNNLTDSALNYLRVFLKTGSEMKLIGDIPNCLMKSRYIFDFAVSHPELKEYKDYIRSIFDAVFERLTYDWRSDKCKARQKIEIENLNDIVMTSFGKLEFRLRGELIPESKWIRKKSKLMFAYLLAKRGAILTKDKMIDTFFSDVNLEKADTTFHTTLSNIRAALKLPDTIDACCPNYLIYEGQTLSLNPDFYYKSDCVEFEKLYKKAKSNLNSDEKIDLLKQAAELYKGEFLPGYYDDWVEDMRQQYSNTFISHCEELIKSLKEKELYDEVITYAEKLLHTDKLHEEANMNLIEAYVKTGNLTAARARSKLMVKNYEEELGEKLPKGLTEKLKKLLT